MIPVLTRQKDLTMATIDDFSLPPEIITEMKKMIEEAPDDAILSYVEATPKLAKGFRPGSKKSVDPLRKRMMRLLEQDREVDTFLMGVIASSSRIGMLTTRLSNLAVIELMPALAQLYGRNHVLAALLADYREEVRDIGIGIIEDDFPLEQVDAEESRETLFTHFEPMLAALDDSVDREEAKGGKPTGTQAPPPPARKGEIEKLRKQVADLENKLKKQADCARNEKALRKKMDALNQQKQKLEKELRELKKLAASEKSNNRDLKAQLKQAREQTASLEATISGRISEGVRTELESLRNRWMLKPLAVEKEAEAIRETGGADELLAGVESILKRQAEVDRHSGDLATLRERIERLNAALQKVRTAMAEALHPLPELGRAESSLTRELSSLETLVRGKPAPQGDFVARMLARINAAESEEELVELQEFLGKLNELDAFSPPELQELYSCCHNRMSIVYAAFTPKVVRSKRYPKDPVWRLINDVEKNRDIVIILDGHNVAHLLPNLFGDSYEDGIPGAATRKLLVQMMVKALKGAAKCQAHVFFDAPSPGRHQPSENVWEVYSGGGQAEHRADKAITQYLEYCCQTMSAMPRLLVTDDRDLRARAVELGAKFMPVPQFGAFLEEVRR